MKRKNPKRLCALLSVILVLALMPVCSFGAEDTLTVMLDKDAINVAEGDFDEYASQVVTANATWDGPAGSFLYQWYSCDASGKIIEEVDNNHVDDFMFQISEEIAGGTHYYCCKVTFVKDGTSTVLAEEYSEKLTINVTPGTRYVIFDPNGGSFPEIEEPKLPYTVEVGADGKLDKPAPMPSAGKEGYRFAGWFAAPEFYGEPIKDFSTITFEHTTRLYAYYGKIHNAVFDANGGSFDEGESQYEMTFIDGLLPDGELPEDPERDGYVFAGWYYKAEDGTERKLELVSGEDNYLLPEDSYEIYAKWDKAEVPGPIETEPSEPKQESLDESPAAGDDKDVLPWMMAAGLAALAGSAVRFRKKSI